MTPLGASVLCLFTLRSSFAVSLRTAPQASLVCLLLLLSKVGLAEEAKALDLSGWWAGEQRTTALVNLPVLGELESSLRIFTLIRIEQRGDELEIRERVCRIDSQVPGPVDLTYSPAFLRGVSGDHKRALLLRDGQTVRFVEAERTRLLGVQLEDPRRDALPMSPTDRRVRDPDRDGKPGLTVHVSGLATGQLYVIQRDTTALEGRVVSPDRIEGVSRWKSEQVVLGATSIMLRSPPEARPHPDPARSPFHYRRLPGPMDCRQVRAQAERPTEPESSTSG